jgi:outer membrane protein assembly factor BamA
LIVSFSIGPLLNGQGISSDQKTIKGWDFSILPSFVYHTDRGIQYGGLASIYYYGDSSIYPEYKYNIYLQSSITTRGGHFGYLFFDSKYLLPSKLRILVDLSTIGNRFQQFYGFNGYDALYNQNYEDPSKNEYLSRSYYYIKKISNIILVDVQGHIFRPQLHWDLGFGYFNINIPPSWSSKNKPSLFEKYVANGLIPVSKIGGGITSYFKTGLIYDTRDNEIIPSKGIWDEAVFVLAPGILNDHFGYTQIELTHRQYFLLQPQIVFAYRIVYQTKLNGDMPFYMFPYYINTFQVQEALGGVKTIRGVLNDRLQGEGFSFGNFEFRYIPINTVVFKKNLSIAFNLFTDLGMITKKVKIDKTIDIKGIGYKFDSEKIHQSIGTGIRFIINHNFIVALDYGKPLDKRDGNYGFYLDLDYLY